MQSKRSLHLNADFFVSKTKFFFEEKNNFEWTNFIQKGRNFKMNNRILSNLKLCTKF